MLHFVVLLLTPVAFPPPSQLDLFSLSFLGQKSDKFCYDLQAQVHLRALVLPFAFAYSMLDFSIFFAKRKPWCYFNPHSLKVHSDWIIPFAPRMQNTGFSTFVCYTQAVGSLHVCLLWAWPKGSWLTPLTLFLVHLKETADPLMNFMLSLSSAIRWSCYRYMYGSGPNARM